MSADPPAEKRRGLWGRLLGGKPEEPESAAPTPADAPPAPAPREAEAEAPPGDAEPKGWFARLKAGLTKTSSRLSDGITSVFTKLGLEPDSEDHRRVLAVLRYLGAVQGSST